MTFVQYACLLTDCFSREQHPEESCMTPTIHQLVNTGVSVMDITCSLMYHSDS